MTDERALAIEGLDEQQRADVTRVLARIARSAPAIEQALDALDHLADSGNLAALDGLFEEFDDNFNAVTRPELMGMMANMMMLMGLLSQVRYEPFFDLAMRAPETLNEAYPAFRARTEPLGLVEMFRMMRSPEMAGALELLAAVARAQHGDGARDRR
jgi:uncharacterized protein YjgD (DUF1641 family)